MRELAVLPALLALCLSTSLAGMATERHEVTRTATPVRVDGVLLAMRDWPRPLRHRDRTVFLKLGYAFLR